MIRFLGLYGVLSPEQKWQKDFYRSDENPLGLEALMVKILLISHL